MSKNNTIHIKVDQYIEDCFRKAEEYEIGVLNGTIITNEWIKLAVKREKELRQKYNYNKERVKKVFKFFYFINLEPNVQYQPIPYQAWITNCIYGLEKENGIRLRKHAIIWIARKTGKTTFTALIALYEFLKGAEQSETYFLATTAQQASQALKYLKAIISYSPDLKKRIDVLAYYLRYKKHSILKPLANNPDRLDGLNASAAVIDESAALPNKDQFNIIWSGMKARKEPLIFEISTAGFRKDYPFYQTIELGKSILSKSIEDIDHHDLTFYALYTLDSEQEIDQPEMWIKSNPSIGQTIQLDSLVEDYNRSRTIQADLNSFIVKNLNYYKEHLHTWIEDEFYKKCFTDFNLDDLRGSRAYMGIDLASTRDLAALVVLIEKDGKFYVKAEHFLPQNQNALIRMSGLDLSDWIKNGFITQTDKPTIDYSYISERISYYASNFNVYALGYDQWNSSQIIPDLQLELGLYCIKCPQNTAFFNLPLRYIEKYIMEENILLDKNPVLRWMFRNVILYTDGNANIKIMKNKSKDSVDGVVALGMAMGMYLKDREYLLNNTN